MTDPPGESLQPVLNHLNADEFPRPEVGLILGSGLGGLAERVEGTRAFPCAEIPGFPESTVEGHAGELVLGRLKGREAAVMRGRFHYYEGYSMEQVTLPVRVLGALGVSTLIVTNASGGIHPDFEPGRLVLIEDHINLLGTNPLIGADPGDHPRFVDMTHAYPASHRRRAREEARHLDLELPGGVYAATTGPSYETPAEITMLERLGADLVGMSTVPEVIVANQLGLEVLGLSCVTNRAAGRSGGSLDHEDVIRVTEEVKPTFESLVHRLAGSLPVNLGE